MKLKSESKIQSEILKYLLNLNNCFAVRYNGWLIGVPDIIANYKNHFLGIEVKRKNGIISPAQQIMKKVIEKSGGKVYFVTDIKDVKKIIEGINEEKKKS